MKRSISRTRLSTVSTLALLSAAAMGSCGDASPSEVAAGPAHLELSKYTLSTAFPVGTVVDTYGDAVLSELETGFGRVRILRVAGSHYDMGYQYGWLVGDQMVTTWDSLMDYMGAAVGVSGEQAEKLLGPMLDRVYKYLEPYVPAEFDDEMTGIEEGATDRGVAASGPGNATMKDVLRWVIALSNVSDLNAFGESVDAVQEILRTGTSAELDQFYRDNRKPNLPHKRQAPGEPLAGPGRTCSFFAAWGPRGLDGKMFSSRNLDWSSDTGISEQALITVYVPDDGYTHATIGYAGFIGALAGINEYGLTASEVGSCSLLEKVKGEPWTIRYREILANARTLREAVPYITNEYSVNRPTTLGYNFMISYGDPTHNGASAAAAVFETNGGVVSMDYRDTACNTAPKYYTYGRDGRPQTIAEYGQSDLVDQEADAKEIDAAGEVRFFQVDANGNYVRDESGHLIDDPNGQPLQVGRYLSCAIYRGDEAMGYGTRMWQTAANGPGNGDPTDLMVNSGSYKNRYLPMEGILEALATGNAYSYDGVTWVETGATGRKVGLDEATDITRAAAMGGNVMSVVYAPTDLKIRVAFESGTGSTWVRAADNPYAEIDMKALFDWN